MIDKGELDDALIHFLRDAEKDKAEGRTLARLFDMLDDHGRRISALETRRKPPSDPPAPKKRQLDSLITIDGDEITQTRVLKEQVAPIVAAITFMSTLKSVAIGVLGVVVAVVTIYAAVFKK